LKGRQSKRNVELCVLNCYNEYILLFIFSSSCFDEMRHTILF